MASLAALATRNFTTRLAGILMAAPVAGLRPMRALRFTRTKFAQAGKGERVFGVLAGQSHEGFQGLDGLGFGQAHDFRHGGDNLRFGQCFCHTS